MLQLLNGTLQLGRKTISGRFAPVQNSLRKSRDKVTNQFGKIVIDFCHTFQCTPLNGTSRGDLGQFTFVADQGNSVVDYFLICHDLFMKCDMSFEVGLIIYLFISLSPAMFTKQKRPKSRTKERVLVYYQC